MLDIEQSGKVAAKNAATEDKGRQNVKTKKRGVAAWIIAAAVITAALVGFSAVGLAAQHSGKIFPNVIISGIDIGGLTAAEAVQKLEASAFENNSGKAVNVDLGMGVEFAVSTDDAGLVLTPSNIAQEAFLYGRSGNFFSNSFEYFKSLVFGADFKLEAVKYIDEAAVRSIIDEAAETFDQRLQENYYSVSGGELVFVKGAADLSVDRDEVYNLIYNAFASANFDGVKYSHALSSEPRFDLKALYDSIYTEPVNAYYNKETDGITDSVTGVSFDMTAAEGLIKKAADGDTIRIPLIFTEPGVTTQSLGELLFRDVLYSKTTSLTSNSNRNNNVSLSAAAINGLILNPGEEFSFNDIVGERTIEKGYKIAGAYVNGQVVDEVGGGICQVSSTLYYCCLHANLEIVARYGHQFTVSYLPLGMDATVSWGGPDFKFRNNTDYPIKILAWRDGKKLTMEIHGTKTTDEYVEMSYVVLSSTSFDTIYKEDESIPEGVEKVDVTGATGYVVETYKSIFAADGERISKEFISKTKYNKRDKVILVAPGSLETEEPVEEPPVEEPPVEEPPVEEPPVEEPPVEEPPVEEPPTEEPPTPPSGE